MHKAMRTVYMLLIGLVSTVGMAVADDTVYFADPILKEAVKDALHMSSDPTPTDMQGLISLTAVAKSITDLTGLQYAENLQSLNISKNQIVSLSPIAGLTHLQTLIPNNNQISNLSPLSGLTQLKHLDIHENEISNISPLSGLTSLEYLSLHDNQVSNLAPLAGLKQLKTLYLHLNPIQNVSPLAELDNLQDLKIDQALIENISALAGLPKLRSVSLIYNNISSLPTFTSTNLKSLYLRNNRITNISPLIGITSLSTLDLQNNPLNYDACRYKIPQIMMDNPGINIQVNTCDPNPTLDYSVMLSSDRGGSVISPGEGEYSYRYGVTILIEAKADFGYTFVGWTGSHSDINNPTWLTVDQTHQIHANFESVLDVLYVDVNGPGDVGPFDPNVSDPNESGTADHPFDSIQEAIDMAKEGATVQVRPGRYTETIDFQGKSLGVLGLPVASATQTGQEPNVPGPSAYPVIDARDAGPVVSFVSGKDANSLLQGFVITGGAGAVVCSDSIAVLSHCVIAGNNVVLSSAGAIYGTNSDLRLLNSTIADNQGGLVFLDSTVELKNTIVWGNTLPSISLLGASEALIHYCDIEGLSFTEAVGTLSVDPLFVFQGYWSYAEDANGVWVMGDYHLQSAGGHWDAVSDGWILDGMMSPCIDVGDPLDGIGFEPEPNGGVINMGAYGGTLMASKSQAGELP